jgi:predicted AAA+ superfamily ATPase
MGAKTFRYENGEGKSEVKFNFSEEPQARELMDWFERMGESAEHRIELERTAKYDRLGVLKALLLLESAMDRKRLVGMDQYLPMLDRIAKNESYMHTARERAAEIAEAIRNPKP